MLPGFSYIIIYFACKYPSNIRNVLGLGFCGATNLRDAPGSWRVLATTCALRRTPRRPSSPPIGYGGPVIPMVCSGFINMFLIEIGKTLGSCPIIPILKQPEVLFHDKTTRHRRKNMDCQSNNTSKLNSDRFPVSAPQGQTS